MPELILFASLGVLAYLYARGWRAREPHARLRALAFAMGLTLVLVALSPPVHDLADKLFLAHMLQHLVLIMVAVPLVLLGAPLGPVLRGLPPAARLRLQRSLAHGGVLRRVVDAATQPLIALGTYVVLLSVWHLPALYGAALESEALHVLEHVSFVLGALVFWAQVIDPAPFRARLSYPLRIVYLFVATAHNTALGGILSFAEPTLYRHYASLDTRLWGIPPLTDQQWGGILMWVPGGMVHLVAISLVFMLWLSAEDRADLRWASPAQPDEGAIGRASEAGEARDLQSRPLPDPR